MTTELALPTVHPFPALPHLDTVDVLGAWLAALRPSTLKAYSGDVAHFAAFLGHPGASQGVAAFLASSQGDANKVCLLYLAHMQDQGLASATVARRLAAIRSLVRCARMLGAIPWTVDVASPKAKRYRDTRGPGVTGYRAMVGELQRRADEGDVKAIRDMAIVRLLHDLGLRRGEVVALDLEDVDPSGDFLQVVGKGTTDKVQLTLPDPTMRALAAWIAVRGGHEGPLFTRLDRAGSGTGRLTGDAVHDLVRGLGASSGLERTVRPHGLRHQAITAVLAGSNGNLEAAQKFARHADPRVTVRYNDNRQDLAGEMARMIAGE